MLVNRPYSNWSKLSNALSNHSLLGYHRNCLQDSDTLKATIDNPTCRLDVMTNASIQVRMNVLLINVLFDHLENLFEYCFLIGERAKRARHSPVCSIENRGYIYNI